MKKLTGLKKAVGEYQRFNNTGDDSRYAYLMYDELENELWTDVFCSLGHNEWIEYHSPFVIDLGSQMHHYDIDVTMKNVKDFIETMK